MPALALLAAPLVALAAGPATPCKPRPQPPMLPAFERRVREAQSARRGFDLPAGRRHVVRILRSPRSKYHYALDGPASPRELRYFRVRQHVSDAADVAAQYMLEEAPELYGGLSIEDDGERGAYVRVTITGDRAIHEPRLRERFPLPGHLRFAEVRFSLDELRAVQNEVSADSGALDRDGFDVRTIGADERANRVDVELVTRRRDPQAFFAARYGPAVRARVIARKPYSLICNRVQSYRPVRGGRVLALGWETNSAYEFVRVDVRETEHQVRLGFVERAPNGPVTLAGVAGVRRVRLSRPLGDRTVVSIVTGRRIPLSRPR